VALGKQLLEAYEGTRKVFEARVASGAWMLVNGEYKDYRTSHGKLSIRWKRPSSHMQGGVRGASDYYDLPGVPFCSYFSVYAEAIHGAYWHNDFGRPRSHGCLNVLPRHARWMYRWVEPVIQYDEGAWMLTKSIRARWLR
jgi:lipoprotein-anchoring transpeptidase ErfK/SrfK